VAKAMLFDNHNNKKNNKFSALGVTVCRGLDCGLAGSLRFVNGPLMVPPLLVLYNNQEKTVLQTKIV
jgi:hypothetical protein